MSVNDMLEEFLKNKPEGYKKDIQIFFNFLNSKELPLIKEVIQGIRTVNVIESINYYKDNNNLASVSTAKRYAAAISEFFKYIIGNSYIENKEFYEELTLPTTINKSYLCKINEYISKDKDLKERDTFEIFKDDEVEELIYNCDEVLNKNIDYILAKSKEYNKFISALCIKLIAFNGIMYRELRKINITDDINKYNKIAINNFRITLPEKYSQQLKKYLIIREQILNDNNHDSKYLFITFKGEQLPVTTGISGFLATCTGRNDLNGLIKYSIRNMITAGVNDSIIERFTGASKDIIEQTSYNENIYDELYWNRYLDSRIRNVNLFDIL